MWSDWLDVSDCGFCLSALWCPLSVPPMLLGFLLPWMWGISSQLLQQSTAPAPYLGCRVALLGCTPVPSQLPCFLGRASGVAQWWRIHLPMQETQVWSLGLEDSLEKEMATHSSIHAWKSPWLEDLANCSPRDCKELHMSSLDTQRKDGYLKEQPSWSTGLRITLALSKDGNSTLFIINKTQQSWKDVTPISTLYCIVSK